MKKTMIIAAAMVAMVSLWGCSGSDESDGSSKYLEKVTMVTAFPELEKAVYHKAINSILNKCKNEGASPDVTDMAVRSTVSQLPSTFTEIKGMPRDQQKQLLESMVRDMQL